MRSSKQRQPSFGLKLSEMSVQEKEKTAVPEIRRLHKQFWIAAEKIKSYGANVRKQMQAQEKEIKSLAEEHKDLSTTLSLLQGPRNVMLDERNCMELQDLFQTKDQYDSLIRYRKAQLSDLDKEIIELEKRVKKQNQIAVKVKQANNSKQLQKQIETLELHLNNVTVYFDTILTRKKELREEIENLRTQKAVLDNVYLKLQKRLDQQKRRMTTDVEQSARAYNQWMKTLARISAINEMRREDDLQYKIKQQEWNRAFEQETKLINFMVTKSADRSKLEEKAKKRKALKAVEQAKQNHWESFESQEVAYWRLLELAEDGDIDRLLNSFVAKEQKNFSNFTYAGELNVELEMLQRRNQDLKRKIMMTTTALEQEERSSLHVLQELEKTLIEITEGADWYEEFCNKSSAFLDLLKSSMKDLLKIISYDDTTVMKLLEENGQITDENLLQFWGCVENKTKELLLMESLLSSSPADGSQPGQLPSSPLLGSPRLLDTMDQAQLCPPAPALDGATNTIHALEVQLDRDQLFQEPGDGAEQDR